jgi:hypothetical protein
MMKKKKQNFHHQQHLSPHLQDLGTYFNPVPVVAPGTRDALVNSEKPLPHRNLRIAREKP